MKRARFLFFGRVQGIGFRYTTSSIARRHEVVGYVHNLRDGSVELEIEGQEPAIRAFTDEIKRTVSGYIQNISESWSDATGEFSTFEVKF